MSKYMYKDVYAYSFRLEYTAPGALALSRLRLGYVSMIMMMMVPQQNYFDRGVVAVTIVRGEGNEGGGGTSNVFSLVNRLSQHG